MAGWTTLSELVEEEFRQAREEGRDPIALDALRPEFEAAKGDEARLGVLHAQLLKLPMRADFAFDEPSDLDAIRAARNGASRRVETDFSDAKLFDKMHGAWLGRCVGCALGKPVEGFMWQKEKLQSWQRQKTYLTAITPDEWPLRDYFPQNSPAQETTGNLWCPASTREQIAFMETDDDIRYTVLGQVILMEFGPDFTSSQVAHSWLERLSYNQMCTAETQAYRNMVLRHDEFRARPRAERATELDLNTDWNWIVHHLNPYREWIGAQIRVDSYGYAAPGNPELAAEFAFRDARISHVKNGIYGAMLCAAMIAAAFTSNDPREIVEAGLSEIPTTSRLYAEMRQTIAICEKHNCDFAQFENVIEEIYALLGHYDAVHTNNNAAICVAGVLLSGGDFEKGITFAVMGGWDTDCNGATVGSIVGAMTGGASAPTHWTARLNDTLNSQIAGYHPIAISTCAQRSVEIARKVAG